jgi:hypothetical protein
MSNECPDDLLFDDSIEIARDRKTVGGSVSRLNYQGPVQSGPAYTQSSSTTDAEIIDFAPDWCDAFQDDDVATVQQTQRRQQEFADSTSSAHKEGLRRHRKHLRLVEPDHYAYNGPSIVPSPPPVAVSIVNTAMFILERLAIDPCTPPSFLQQIAEHPDGDLRAIVAENQNAPLEVIERLARDNDVNVRYQLAENHNISVIVLQSLSQDDNPYVAFRAQQTLERILW